LDAWLSEHPNCRLAVVDTLKRFRSRRRGNKNAYDVDYEDVEPLASLAYKHKVSIVLVHHYRKDTDSDDPYDALSGSTGLSAAIDGVMLLKRERGSAAAFLYVEGRDIESNEYALAWNTNISGWTIEGDAPKYRLTPERRKIIETQEERGVMGPKEIAEVIGKEVGDVSYLLSEMVKAGQLVTVGYGKYSTIPNSPNTPNAPNTSLPGLEGVSDDGATPNGLPNTSENKSPANGHVVRGVSGVSGLVPFESM
jgi:hypothetical protein